MSEWDSWLTQSNSKTSKMDIDGKLRISAFQRYRARGKLYARGNCKNNNSGKTGTTNINRVGAHTINKRGSFGYFAAPNRLPYCRLALLKRRYAEVLVRTAETGLMSWIAQSAPKRRFCTMEACPPWVAEWYYWKDSNHQAQVRSPGTTGTFFRSKNRGHSAMWPPLRHPHRRFGTVLKFRVVC